MLAGGVSTLGHMGRVQIPLRNKVSYHRSPLAHNCFSDLVAADQPTRGRAESHVDVFFKKKVQLSSAGN